MGESGKNSVAKHSENNVDGGEEALKIAAENKKSTGKFTRIHECYPIAENWTMTWDFAGEWE